MGSSVPASPPPPLALGLCLLLVLEPSITWLGKVWEGAGAVLPFLPAVVLGLPRQNAPGQPGPALRLLH